MHPAIPYLAAFSVAFVLPAAGYIETSTVFSLNPKLFNSKSKECTTTQNLPGICVHRLSCNNAHEIETGGRISVSELRASDECNRAAGEWCCSFKNASKPTSIGSAPPVNTGPPVTSVPPLGSAPPGNSVSPGGLVPPGKPVSPGSSVAPGSSVPAGGTETSGNSIPGVNIPPTFTGLLRQNCIVTNQNDCPWLVKLYRDNEEYPYCSGAMIGLKIILTTATCALQGKNRFLWARVPGSANPEANYTLFNGLSHPKYNSGSRLNDIALFITLANIDWGTDGPKTACIDPQQVLGKECTAGSLNEYYDLDVVSLYVTQGACTAAGNVSDAMCGSGIFENPLPHGTPIMCQKNNIYILSGLTKTSYPDSSKALLGNLDYGWLISNLKKMGLSEDDFLFSRNYK